MRSTPIVAVALASVAAACMPAVDDRSRSSAAPASPGAARDCTPLETRPPNAAGQRPAFEGQTRACGVTSSTAFDVTVVARGLVHPWAVEPLPDGDLLVTERPGRMRVVSANGTLGEPIAGVPPVYAAGQAGLLDVALGPAFSTDRTIFWSYAEPRDGGNGTSVARGVLSADRRALSDVRVIFRALPTYDNDKHFGSRLVFGNDGTLYVTTGERSDAPMRRHAQRLDGHLGKVLRIHPDGSVPEDNPFAGRTDARPEIWSFGHRNIQAIAFDDQGRLWVVEHGAQGGDELNRIEKGANYGWPLQAYGEEYSGEPLVGASTAPAGLEQPVYYWDPVLAPSGMDFYSGPAFPEWRGSLFTGALRAELLARITLDGDRVTGEEHLLAERGQRIRDVREGAEGHLYLVTDEADGEVWRIAPTR